MIIARQAIEDRHAGIACQALDEGARRAGTVDRVVQAAQQPRAAATAEAVARGIDAQQCHARSQLDGSALQIPARHLVERIRAQHRQRLATQRRERIC